MSREPPSSHTPTRASPSAPRKAWQTPAIEDADISALTSGGGNSGVEGTSFLKTGS
jgi:hypothetical protein